MTDRRNRGLGHTKSSGTPDRPGRGAGRPVAGQRALTLLATLLTAVCLLVAPQRPAAADSFVPQSAQAAQAHAHTGEQKSDIQLTIDSSTPVVSDKSGYAVKVTISNQSDQALEAGQLQVSTNSLYTFSSRIDMQDWAERNSRIPTPDELASKEVGNIPAKQSVKVTASVPADSAQLKAMTTWGPKPLLLSYHAHSAGGQRDGHDSEHKASATSFVTRSQEGLKTAKTPPLSVSMLMPVTTSQWSVNQEALTQLVTGQAQGKAAEDKAAEGKADDSKASSSSADANKTDASKTDASNAPASPAPSASASPSSSASDHHGSPESAKTGGAASASILTLSAKAVKVQAEQEAVIRAHPDLNTLADPSYIGNFHTVPRLSAAMQPAAFDLSAYSSAEASRYQDAGVSPADWSAQKAKDLLELALTDSGQSSQSIPTYAWQGGLPWSLASLAQAKNQGYGTVIAPDGLDADSGASAHTGKYTVPTDSGDVTILSAQQELSKLAQGQPTTSKATGEHSEAGQTARFMAQSAFYQMEQPYAERDILVCFDSASSTHAVDALMTALEHASWIRLSSLDQLAQAKAYARGDDAQDLVNQTQKRQLALKASKNYQQGVSDTLNVLADSKADISRFSKSILASKSSAQASPSASSGKSDTQALARQDASNAARRSANPNQWLERINQTHDQIALKALASTGQGEALRKGASSLSNQLLNKVQIKPSESLTVVSETATMPVTVSNNHPYPVAVTVSSLTDSMEIVTTRKSKAVIPANSEVQVTFTIRVAQAGHAIAHISLLDQAGRAFGQEQETHINSNLRLSDMSGLLIVAIAFAFGALGLWRQFHRKKDPDE